MDAVKRLVRSSLLASLLLAAGCSTLRIDRDDAQGRLAVLAGDHEIVGWCYGREQPVPHWFPLRSPSGKDLLIQHPDPYPHHRAMWIADKVQLEDGPVVDYYHHVGNQVDPVDASKGHRHFLTQMGLVCEVQDGKAVITASLQWLGGGKPVLFDQRTLVATPLGGGEALLDLSWTLTAAFGAVTFHSDWVHYGWPFLRMHPQFSVDKGGALVDDVGRSGQQATNGQYANWMDYSGTVDGVTEGVAVFVPQDGQWHKWLTRDYGCFGPRRPDAQSGAKFTLAKGEQLGGRVRIFVHRGDAAAAGVARRYRDFVEGR